MAEPFYSNQLVSGLANGANVRVARPTLVNVKTICAHNMDTTAGYSDYMTYLYFRSPAESSMTFLLSEYCFVLRCAP
jgi:hypothetical protein